MGMAGQSSERGTHRTVMHGAPLTAGSRMMAGLVRHLTPAQAVKLGAGRQRQALRVGRVMVYRDHIPYVSFLVLEGTVGFELGRGTRLARSVTLSAPLLIGEHHATHRQAFPMTVRVLDKVVMCFVGCPTEQTATVAMARRGTKTATVRT